MSYFLYHINEMKNAALWPAHLAGEAAEIIFKPLQDHPLASTFFPFLSYSRYLSASGEFLERSTRIYGKPEFGIKSIQIDGKNLPIVQETAAEKPFCTLTHFKKKTRKKQHEPKVMILAPLSGHFATLLRDTANAMLPGHDVYITDWKDSRMVASDLGDFSLENYVEYILDFIKALGPRLNIIAVCQPTVPLLAATALLAERNDPLQPLTITLMGGPVDTRVNPGKVDHFVKEHDIEWYLDNIITKVPLYYPGSGRNICPGFMMLGGFMSLNMDKHEEATIKLYENLMMGDEDSAETHRRFYDEYRSVMDLPATYFLDSLENVFYKQSLPKGKFKWKGHKINLKAIEKTSILTIEGEKDDISPVGQTFAVHDLCPYLPSSRKGHHMQENVGHYGIFNGSRWRKFIQPKIAAFIKEQSKNIR